MLTEACFKVAQKQGHPIYQFRGHLDATEGIVRIVRDKADSNPMNSNPTGAEGQFFRTTRAVTKHLIDQGLNAEAIEFVNGRLEEAFLATFEGRSSLSRERARLDDYEREFGRPKVFDQEILRATYPSEYIFDGDFLDTEREAENLLRSFWRRSVVREKSSLTISARIDDDVDALVQLTLINRRLINGHEKMRHRLVFVTGDRNLVRAAYGVIRSKIDQEIRSYVLRGLTKGNLDAEGARLLSGRLRHYFGVKIDDQGKSVGESSTNYIPGWFENFSHHYVRHFWSICGDALIDLGTENDRVRDFFHGFFANAGDRLKLSRRNLEQRVLRSVPLDLQVAGSVDVQRVLRDWEALTRRRLTARRVSSVSLEDFLTFSAKAQPTQLPKIFMELSERQRDRSMVQVSDYGAESVLRDRGVVPPDLHFRTMPVATRMFQWLATNNYSEPGLFQKDFEALSGDCHVMKREKGDYDDRQLSHVKFLVLAVAFAASEKWAAAQGHVERARRIIIRELDGNVRKSFDGEIRTRKDSYMSGREATYLAAICHRMRAAEQKDFERCATLLEETHQLTVSDWKRNRKKLDLAYHNARIENERWSLNLAKYFYERSLGARSAGAFVAAVQNSALHEEILNFLDREISDDYQLTKDAISFNFLQSYAIFRFRMKLSDDEEDSDFKQARLASVSDRTRQALAHLTLRLSNENYLEPAATKCYRMTIALCEKSWGFYTFRDQLELELLFSKATYEDQEMVTGRRNASRAKYDLWRLRALREFALDLWNARD